MLNRQCQIYDIEDIEAFVIMCIKRSGCKPATHEWEDMIATGLMLLWEMSNNYKPSPTGDKRWCFSGYAVRYMPKKLKEAYHRNLEHAIKAVDDEGKRTWSYRLPAQSFDVMTQQDRDGHTSYDESRFRLTGNFIDVPQQTPASLARGPVSFQFHTRASGTYPTRKSASDE